MSSQKANPKKGVLNNPKRYISMIPDKAMREAANECNNDGVWLWRTLPSFELFELSSMDFRITKDNVRRIFNILRVLSENNCLNIRLIYRERDNVELIRIYANNFQREKVFKLIKSAVKKKCNIEKLREPIQEVYKMHRMLTDEDIEHQAVYKDIGILKMFVMKNVNNSYFYFGLTRVRNIFCQNLPETTDKHRDVNYTCGFDFNSVVLKKLKKINKELEAEFKWQADEFDKMCAKYRHDPNDEDSDMFVRLAKVRDAYTTYGVY